MVAMTWHSIHGGRSKYWWRTVKVTDDVYGRCYNKSSQKSPSAPPLHDLEDYTFLHHRKIGEKYGDNDVTLNQWQQVLILMENWQIDLRCIGSIFQRVLIKNTIATPIAWSRRLHLPAPLKERLAISWQWRDTQSMAAGPYIDGEL